jgi:putative transcriptional regulator
MMKMRTRIKELRARYDLTQDELADIVDVSRRTMLYLEKGKYNPSLFLAYKVAKVLHSTIEEVFIIEEDEEISSQDGDALNLE